MPKVLLKNRLDAQKRPDEVALIKQNWTDLLFLHWEYSPTQLQKTLPPGLFVDTFNKKGYVSIAVFGIENVSFVNFPTPPGFSSFIEVNVRTYVYDKNGTPGVWFYSLDINSFMASKAARTAFSLPYFFAELIQKKEKNEIIVEGKRVEEPEAYIKFAYKPLKKAGHVAKHDTLDFFLLERYVLFSFEANSLSLGRVYHEPYLLQEVTVTEWSKDLLEVNAFESLSKKEPNEIHYCSILEVEIFNLKKAFLR